MAEPVEASNLRVESHVDLQSQIDDLSAALQDWRRTREYSQPTEERLTRITLQCARMVESWQRMEQGRGAAGAGVEPRGGNGSAAPRQRTGERIHDLERTIEHEWNALREGHDRPDRQLRDQAVSLAESCVTAANLTLRGFASVESRLSALEQDLQGRMAQLAHDLQSVVAELRSARPQALPGATPAFPLESVMRIHEEMRGSNAAEPAGALKPAPARALPEWTESATALTARMESLEQAVGSAAAKTARPTRAWRYSAAGFIVVALTGLVVFSVWMQRRVDARLNEAAVRVSAAERQRDATTAAVRQEAARQVADARQSAAQAQIVGNVLAAPDRIRYWMAGAGANSRAYAQLLFSRSRGIVFSASRLEPVGGGKTYQLWLLTRDGPVSLGLVTPDTGGRVTLATDALPNPLGRLTGALVTLEPEGGRPQPSQDNVLIRIE